MAAGAAHAALELLKDDSLERSGPENIHDWIKPDEVSHDASECPKEHLQANYIRWVLAIPLRDVEHKAID